MNETKKRLQLSIGGKMILFCLMLLIVPVLILGSISYTTAREETGRLIEKDLEHGVKLAAIIASNLDAAVRNGQMSLEEAQESFKELILGPRHPDGTRPINRDIDLGENGYFFVLDPEGTLLAHPNREGDNIWDSRASDGTYYIRDMIERGMNGGGFTYYEWPLPNSDKSALKVSYSYFIPEWGWILGGGSYYQDYNEGQRKINRAIQLTMLLCLVVGSLAVTWFARRISRPLTAIARQAEEISGGNLKVPAVTLKRRDEIGRLADHFGRMKENLRDLVSEMQKTGDRVKDAVRVVHGAIAQTGASAGQIGRDLEAFTSGIGELAAGTEQSAQTMEDLSKGVQRIADMAASAHENAAEMGEKARAGQEMIGQSVRQMEKLADSFHTIVQTVQQLIRDSTLISEMNRTIREIAEQTQLLALNAAIEAAKAGEQGRGFAVVAGEVRKLADQSSASSERIEELVQSLHEAVGSVNAAIQTGEAEMLRGETLIRQTGEMFQSLYRSARAVLGQVEETSAAGEQMSSGTAEISATIRQISELSSGFSANAESISAAAQEVLASIEEIRLQVGHLLEQTERLDGQIRKFAV